MPQLTSIDDLLEQMVGIGASDLHITVGSPPAREDVESIHDEVAGFVNAGETDVEGGSVPPAEN